MIEADPDSGGVPCAIPVLPRCLTQSQYFIPAQMLTRSTLMVSDAPGAVFCSIFSIGAAVPTSRRAALCLARPDAFVPFLGKDGTLICCSPKRP
jgi:hypothetical protein